jgi:RNA polymerase sigma-70 factor, ECF subfamily
VTDVFARHRPRLFGVAYRMLGSATEADDVVQETWLRWRRVDESTVEDPERYLVRIATRVAIDVRRRTPREDYVGPWLPEPLLTEPDVADGVVATDSLSVALLVVLETLSPLERAVFVLHEAFGFGYGEIAAMLDRTEPAVRQLGHRARAHVRARRPRFEQDRAVRAAATERFVSAALGGDLTELMAVLAPDVEFVADSGGKVRAPRRVLRGAARVARLFAATNADIPAGTEVVYRDVNGEPAAILLLSGQPYTVFWVTVESGLVSIVRVLGNPDKLGALARAL